MSHLNKFHLRIDVEPATDIKTIAFVCGESEVSGHRSAVTIESTPRQLTHGELYGTLQEFLATQQGLLEAELP
jgi:hypothetical protein